MANREGEDEDSLVRNCGWRAQCYREANYDGDGDLKKVSGDF